jgi:hypothetical protein
MGIKKKNMATDEKIINSDFLNDANKSIGKTESLQTKDIKKVMIGIKINEDYKDILEKHFRDYRGTNISNGIRELIYSYMRENKLIK